MGVKRDNFQNYTIKIPSWECGIYFSISMNSQKVGCVWCKMVAFNGLPSKLSHGKDLQQTKGWNICVAVQQHPIFFCVCVFCVAFVKFCCQDPGDPGTKLATGTRSLCSTDGAIAALLMDGRVQVWGDAMNGGNFEEVPGSGWWARVKKQMECLGKMSQICEETLT